VVFTAAQVSRLCVSRHVHLLKMYCVLKKITCVKASNRKRLKAINSYAFQLVIALHTHKGDN
jgi:hypothetical protein